MDRFVLQGKDHSWISFVTEKGVTCIDVFTIKHVHNTVSIVLIFKVSYLINALVYL